MRIISNFRDYYDGVMKTGMDRNVVYVRETKEVLIPDDFEVYYHNSTEYTYSLRYLGFCGQIYRLATITNSRLNFRKNYYNLEDFKKESLALGATSNWDFTQRWWKGSIVKFFEEDPSKLLEFFHKYQTPVFLVQESSERHKQKLILNPCLQIYKFQTVKDSYTTYQDIFQYVAGVLNSPENKMVKISDKDKISKHGFDKWSFRTHPDQKKGKK